MNKCGVKGWDCNRGRIDVWHSKPCIQLDEPETKKSPIPRPDNDDFIKEGEFKI